MTSTLKAPLPWPARIRRSVLNWMVEALECGPMDGGCVLVARALAQRFQGDVVCLIRSTDGTADHAMVALPGGWLVDMDGLHRHESDAVSWFNHQEMAHTTHVRAWKAEDLQAAAALVTPPHLDQMLKLLPKSLPKAWQAAFSAQPARQASSIADPHSSAADTHTVNASRFRR